ncbi:MAG: replicative DNA helicase [Actinomycetota bacterium]|nr:replicative DNA helicase [Actinomycetota bacterium]
MTQVPSRSTRKSKEVLQRATPHNLEAEESLLGAMLLSKDAIADAIEICQSADFYKPSHQHIFEALTAAFARGDPADTVTIAEELKRKNVLEDVGGVPQLLKLQADTPAIGNAFSYAEIVVEYSLLRRLIRAANDIAEKAYEVPDDVVEVIDWAETLIFDVAQRRQSETMAHIKEVLGNALDDLEALYARSEAVTGIPTGFNDLDNLLSGLHASNLVIVGARPGMGKTAFALGVAASVAMKQKVPVLLFSLEMSRKELVQRLLSAEAQIDSTRMRNGKLLEKDWEKISHAIGRLADAPIYIDDNPNVNVMDIRAKSRRLKARDGLGLVVVDYLQLMSGRMGAESRQVEVSEISRGLKILARELDVPVLALSQLSRNLEMRADKRPALSDLRESGCLSYGTQVLMADGSSEAIGDLVRWNSIGTKVVGVNFAGEFVESEISRTYFSGIKQTYVLDVGDRQIRASANHKFLTRQGWMPVDNLRSGIELAVHNGSAYREEGALLTKVGSRVRLGARVYWTILRSIESYGTEPVYDLTVPGTHNFIANGIVVHNSLEQDADVVLFIYRDEIYNSESSDRGTAEIIVAKHRSGPTGVAHLAFLDSFTKFVNMAQH